MKKNDNSYNLFDFFDKILSDEVSKIDNTLSESDLYEEIVENYFIILKKLGIKDFNVFRFAEYDYCREIIVDGNKYDLDSAFSHNDADATEALCTVDCLISDLEEDEEEILKTVEKMINQKNVTAD